MPAERLKEYLDSHNIEYEIIEHPRQYTAQQVAAVTHTPGSALAKTVIIKIKGKLAMAVLPASYRVDFALLRNVVGDEDVELAREHEFKDIFPDCEIGAMPPFGNLYGVDVFVAEKLTKEDKIAFNACAHDLLARMAYKDFEGLVKPKVVRFSMD